MKKYILLAIVGSLFAISCNKKMDPYTDTIADVFIRSFKNNNTDSYNAVFSVISVSQMSGVTVDIPNGSSIQLSKETSDGLSFSKDTSLIAGGGYSHVPPPSGIYTFHVTYTDGSQKVFANTLGSDYLLPPVIDSLYRKPDGVSLRLKWKPVDGANAYQMRISSGHNEIMPWMEYGNSNQLFYENRLVNFSAWLPGTLTFEIRGVKHESDRNYMQAISYTSIDFDL